MHAKFTEIIKDDEKFEKGLSMLLKHAYHAPQPSEAFRQNLLQDLKNRQRQAAAARRSRVIKVVFGGAATLTAAAAAVAFAFLPQVFPTTPAPIPAAESAVLAAAPAIKTPESLNGAAAFALQPLNIKMPGSDEWQALNSEEQFALLPDMEISTPVGALENTGFGVRNGPAVMLVGMSRLRVARDGGLRVMDGQAMLDLSRTAKACDITLNDQTLSLQPGAMVLASVDMDDNYAAGGAPAPTLAVLHGSAATRSPDNATCELNSGRIYDLYDTGTGRYPHRSLSSAENQQRFQPMIDAIRAANVKQWK